jgi:hypothetical protein
MRVSRSKILVPVATPAIVSSFVVLPFVILEAINRPGFADGFPMVLFVVMWALPATFVLVLTALLRRLRAGDRAGLHLGTLVASTVLLISIAWFWVRLVIDQLPCFLGVPNCD